MSFIHRTKAKSTNGFPSKLESAVYDILRIRENAKEIRNIKRQQVVVLQDGPSNVRIVWKVDFQFEERMIVPIEHPLHWRIAYAEAKGIETEDYKIKLKLWRKNPPAPLEIYKGNYKRPALVERIEV